MEPARNSWTPYKTGRGNFKKKKAYFDYTAGIASHRWNNLVQDDLFPLENMLSEWMRGSLEKMGLGLMICIGLLLSHHHESKRSQGSQFVHKRRDFLWRFLSFFCVLFEGINSFFEISYASLFFEFLKDELVFDSWISNDLRSFTRFADMCDNGIKRSFLNCNLIVILIFIGVVKVHSHSSEKNEKKKSSNKFYHSRRKLKFLLSSAISRHFQKIL